MFKRIQIIGRQKLAKSIYIVIEKLKLSCKGKTKLIKKTIKQFVKLYRNNNRLLTERLILL